MDAYPTSDSDINIPELRDDSPIETTTIPDLDSDGETTNIPDLDTSDGGNTADYDHGSGSRSGSGSDSGDSIDFAIAAAARIAPRRSARNTAPATYANSDSGSEQSIRSSQCPFEEDNDDDDSG